MVSYELSKACTSGLFWVVEEGDTLFAISKETGIPLEEIIKVNPGINPENLLIGSKICLPDEVVLDRPVTS